MIGPGTGVAPFIGFLQHREALFCRQNCAITSSHGGTSQESNCHTAHTITPVSFKEGLDTGSSACYDEVTSDPRASSPTTSRPSGNNPSSHLKSPSDSNRPDPSSVPPLSNSSSDPSISLGKTWLFFGCRNPDRDSIYREELEHFKEIGCLNKLNVAYSQSTFYQTQLLPSSTEVYQRQPITDQISPPSDKTQPPDDKAPPLHSTPPRYVQDLMKVHWKELCGWLLEEEGYLYVCG
jgi:hypothetical protein